MANPSEVTHVEESQVRSREETRNPNEGKARGKSKDRLSSLEHRLSIVENNSLSFPFKLKPIGSLRGKTALSLLIYRSC